MTSSKVGPRRSGPSAQLTIATETARALDVKDEDARRAAQGTPYVFSRQIGHLLRRAYQRHLNIFQALAYDPNLTAVQFATLCALHDNGPSSQGELVKATKIDQATIRGIIDRLRARGLVMLTSDQQDRRKVIVDLTAEGDTILAAMIPCAVRISEATMAKLNDAERVAAIFVLRKMFEDDAG